MLATACAAAGVHFISIAIKVHPVVKLTFTALGCFGLSGAIIFAWALCAREFGLVGDEPPKVLNTKINTHGSEVILIVPTKETEVEVTVDVEGDVKLLGSEKSCKV